MLARAGGARDSALSIDIARAFPDDGIVTRGGRCADLPRGRYTWIVDDVDGGGVEHGPPRCSRSVGVLRDGMPFAGAVYDQVTHWLFTACVGRGAWLNDRPLYAGHGLGSPRALAAADASGDDGGWRWPTMRADGRPGAPSTALRLCHVVVGRVGAVYHAGVSLMEIAGAAPIVLEAGGVLTRADGTPVFPGWPTPALAARVAILAGHPVTYTQALRDVHGGR